MKRNGFLVSILLVLSSARGEKAFLSVGEKITGWSAVKDGIFRAIVPEGSTSGNCYPVTGQTFTVLTGWKSGNGMFRQFVNTNYVPHQALRGETKGG